MNANAKKLADAYAETMTQFDIQVCSENGRLLNEYVLTQDEHDVRTINAAERRARKNLSDYQGDPLVIVVSEQTLTKLRQVQLRVASNDPFCE